MTYVAQRGGTGMRRPVAPCGVPGTAGSALQRGVWVCALERQPQGQRCRTALTLIDADANAVVLGVAVRSTGLV